MVPRRLLTVPVRGVTVWVCGSWCMSRCACGFANCRWTRMFLGMWFVSCVLRRLIWNWRAAQYRELVAEVGAPANSFTTALATSRNAPGRTRSVLVASG